MHRFLRYRAEKQSDTQIRRNNTPHDYLSAGNTLVPRDLFAQQFYAAVNHM